MSDSHRIEPVPRAVIPINTLQLVKFLLPLVLTVIVAEFSIQVLNGGMARMPNATRTLAAYGLAWGLVTLLCGTLTQARQLGLVLVEDLQAYRQVCRFVLGAGLLLSAVLATLAVTPLGTWVVDDLHGVAPPMADTVRRALFWLIPLPLLQGMARLYSGMLIRARRTDVVSLGTLLGIGGAIASVFILLPTAIVRSDPIRLPLIVTYVGTVTDLAVVTVGRRRLVALGAADGRGLRMSEVVRFFWPLALIMGIQSGTRPLINLFVSRGSDGVEALAALTVVYALGHVPYGWVNEVRSLPMAFKDAPNHLHFIRRFAAGCGLLSFGLMTGLFWTPIKSFLLLSGIGVSEQIASLCYAPLAIFSFMPLVVAVRSYYHGIGLMEHRTQALAPSAPSRILAVLTTLLALSLFELPGATRALCALLTGHTVETIVVWWFIACRTDNRRGTT